jgi:hypothetical protein
MGDLVFVSGYFSSGTTLLYTLLRQTDDTYCLYEPLHERLPQWLVWPPRAYEGHAFIGSYFTEYKGFSALGELFDPRWGIQDLFLSADDELDGLYRYLSYLIGTAHGRARHAVLKENRFSFRLGWLRSRFPAARIVHVYRDLDDHWRSIVRRVQDHLGREDVGQDRPDFMGFRLAAWCDDLAATFPELAADRSSSGYERFSKLWRLSKTEQEKHADVSIGLEELKADFPNACARISEAVRVELDPARLQRFLATAPREPRAPGTLGRRLTTMVDRAGARYAEARVASAARRRRASSGPRPSAGA